MQHVDVKVHESIATITLNRPKSRNALSPAVILDLRTAISDVHQEKRVHAVVLTGSGEHFCSGMDFSVLAEIADLPSAEALPEWFATWQQLTELLQDILRLPKPVVAAVDGAALGAGFGLALAADMIVASDRAELAANAVKHGLVGGATAALLAFRATTSLAARMTLTGRPIDAAEAYRLGLAVKVTSPNQIWVAASEIANQCAVGPREALQANKRLLNESVGEQLLTQLAVGANDSATSCTTDAAKEGIKAFVEKRKADWGS